MDSASTALLHLLLRQTDRHPIGGLDGTDLNGIDPRLLNQLLSRGVLEEMAPLELADGMVIEWVDRVPHGIGATADDSSGPLDPDALRRFEISPAALCEALRLDNALGPEIQQVNGRIFNLGQDGVGRTVFLALGVTEETAIEDACVIQAHCSGPAILVAPREPQLAIPTAAYLREQSITVVPADERLQPVVRAPFRLDLIVEEPAEAAEPVLVLNVRRSHASFRGRELRIPRREFMLLLELARGAQQGPGYVAGDALHDAIRDPRLPADAHANDEQVYGSISGLRRAFAESGGLSRDEARKLIVRKNRQGVRLDLQPETIRIV